jgi:chemotaxis signal transduction protein
MLVLTFSIGSSRFAIDARRIVQVVPRVALRALPLMESYLAGVLDVGGRMLPVVDLGVRLTGVPCVERLSTRIVVVQIAHATQMVPLGFVAEQVTDLSAGPETLPSGSGTSPGGMDCLGPILRIDGELIQWIELDRILPESTRNLLYEVVLH